MQVLEHNILQFVKEYKDNRIENIHSQSKVTGDPMLALGNAHMSHRLLISLDNEATRQARSILILIFPNPPMKPRYFHAS